MIHYINGVPTKNVRLNKTKRHAMENYRHMKRVSKNKDIAISVLSTLLIFGTLTAIYLLSN